jgi:hypothetical protein
VVLNLIYVFALYILLPNNPVVFVLKGATLGRSLSVYDDSSSLRDTQRNKDDDLSITWCQMHAI